MYRVVHASGKYKSKHPVEMGPTFVHTHRDTNSYVRFLSALQRMNPCHQLLLRYKNVL
jgi:hypothetical protein